MIGEKIEREVVKTILNDLEIKLVSQNEKGLFLEVPLYRSDVQREVDVIEEILRIYGFNNITFSEKLNSSIQYSKDVNPEAIRNVISDLLSSNGYCEIMNNSLSKGDYNTLIKELNPEENITLLNPLSHDLNTLDNLYFFLFRECFFQY